MKLNQQTFIVFFLLVFSLSIPAIAFSDLDNETNKADHYPDKINGVKIYTSTGNYNIKFYHLKFRLTPENTVLANDEKLIRKGYSRNPTNYRFNILDEQSDNFNCGQFEVFIPVDLFPLSKEKRGFMILRMAQTLSCEGRANKFIRGKQDLYFRIKEMVESGVGVVEVIVELPRYLERNIYFRAARGRYIDYVGQLKK